MNHCEEDASKPVSGAGHSPRLWVRLSGECNNRCLFCHDSESAGKGFPQLSEVEETLRKGRDAGFREVVLSGGEPTINPDFIEIVSLAKGMGYEWAQVVTNGRMFSYATFREKAVAAGLDEVTFSIHSCRPAVHDRMAGAPGAFAQSLRGLLAMLKVPGVTVSQDIVVNMLNVEHLRETVSFFISQGVREFDLLYLIPFGRAYQNRHLLFFEAVDHARDFREVFGLAARNGAKVWTNRAPAELLEGYEALIQPREKLRGEIESHRYIFDDWLARGNAPHCRGDRCAFCFLGGFCSYVAKQEELRRTGAWRDAMWDSTIAGSLPGLEIVNSLWDRNLWLFMPEEPAAEELSLALEHAGRINMTLGARNWEDIREALLNAAGGKLSGLKRLVLSEWGSDYLIDEVPAPELWLPLNLTNAALVNLAGIGKEVVLYRPSCFPRYGAAPSAPLQPSLSKINAGIYNLPVCMTQGLRNIPRRNFFHLHNLGEDGRILVVRALDTYFGCMNYVKSFRCAGCSHDRSCAGINMEDAAGGVGLGALQPEGRT